MTPKQQRAHEIRDAALEWLKYQGTFADVESMKRCRQYKDEDISILLRTPFQGKPFKITEEQKYQAALANIEVKENLPYGLDIWLTGDGKVFNFEWDYNNGDFKMTRFKRGKWEGQLLYSVRSYLKRVAVA